MNNVDEQINIEKAACRNINPQELLQLLRADFWLFASWGATAFIVDSKNDTKMLRFKSNGYKHKGHVYIFLNGSDLFDVYLTTIKGKIIDKTDEMGIYNDMLVDWIDERIEKQPEYVR